MIVGKKTFQKVNKNNNNPNNQIRKSITKNKTLIKSIPLPKKQNETNLREGRALIESKKEINKKNKNNNSLSSKDDIKKKNTTLSIRSSKSSQISKKTNNNKLISSFNVHSLRASTNINKENNKEFRKTFKKNNSNINQKNIPKLNDLIFKKNILKKTIIIDTEGNNNLNINLKNFSKNEYKNILDINIPNPNNEQKENFNSTIFSDTNETNSLFERSSHNNNRDLSNKIKKEKNKKETVTDKNREEKWIKEYNRMFNLLNTNIEQFKKMVNNNYNINRNIYKDNNIIIKKKKNFKISAIPTSRNNIGKNKNIDFNKDNNNLSLKKNFSEENVKFNEKINNDYLLYKYKNNLKNSSNKCINSNQYHKHSFLGSSIDNDFYQSLINKTILENINQSSFNSDKDNISNKENIEVNNLNKIRKTINEKNINKIMLDKIDNNSIKDNENNNRNRKLNTDVLTSQNIEKSNINQFKENNYQNFLDNNNCFIF